MQRRLFMQGTLALGAAAFSSSPWAQRSSGDYPNRPVSFVVPFAAGGGGDAVARLLGRELGTAIDATVVVENRVGAGGNIGAAYVFKAKPDGYTLLNMSSTYAIQAAVTDVPFDPIADMQPIVMVSRDPVVIVVPPGSRLHSAAELVRYAKQHPGALSYGSAGVGSIAHLGMEELAFNLGIKLMHVPYKGTSQAFSDLLAGSIDLMLSSATFAAPLIKAGRLSALGISGSKRTPTLPDIPTFPELGYPPYMVYDWKAIAGPKNMAPETVEYLNRELNAVLKVPAVRDRLEGEGAAIIGGSPEQMLQTIRSDIEHWKRVAVMAKVEIK